jgi:hypothetical protein
MATRAPADADASSGRTWSPLRTSTKPIVAATTAAALSRRRRIGTGQILAGRDLERHKNDPPSSLIDVANAG